jgi:hypothetical protein
MEGSKGSSHHWMLFCTHHRNCTLTTMNALMYYHVTLYRESCYTHHSNRDAHHYVSTDVEYDYWLNALLQTSQQYVQWSAHMCCYHVSLYNVGHYTQLRNMRAHHCVYVDVLKSWFLKWMSFFTHHSNNGVHNYVCVGVLSCHSFEWMPYSSITSPWALTTMYTFVCYKVTLYVERLTPHITVL